MDAYQKLAEAKTHININDKLFFYGCTLAQLDLLVRPIPSGTASTDGKTITFDGTFLESLPMEQTQGVILHELRHVTDMHTLRVGNRDRRLFNEAADHVINLELLDEGFKLPSWVLADRCFVGMSVEEVYEQLVQNPEKQKENKMPDLGEPGVDSQPEPGENTNADGSTPPQLSAEQQAREIEQDIRDILVQAVQMTQRAKGTTAGYVPANIQMQVDAWLKPVVPWTTILRRYFTSKVVRNSSWKKPKRRNIAHGLYLPVTQGKAMGDINIYMDLSGSVSDEMASMQASQFRYIHQMLKPSLLRVITFNTRIIKESIYKARDKLDLSFVGRGGTNISEVIQHMKANPAEIHLIFTDGYFSQYPLDGIRGDIVFCIYDNKDFSYKGATVVIELPEK